MVRTRGIRLQNARDQIEFCAFHPFLVEVQTNAEYVHAMHVLLLPAKIKLLVLNATQLEN